MGGKNLDHVAAHPERAAVEVAGAALVLQRHQVGDQLALIDALALLERERHRRVGLDRADAVDAGYRRHDDDVVALEQGARGGVAHAVDLLVDRGFLLDVGVGARNIGLGLVVVVIADEVFDRVVGEERPEFAVELGRERLVRGKDQRRPLDFLDHLGHGESLARAGDAEQNLGAVLALDALDDVGDRLRLVALGLEIRLDHQPLPAFGLLRSRRPVRHPWPLAEFRAALPQQRFQRLDGGGCAGDAAERCYLVLVSLRRLRVIAAEAERLRQLRIHAHGSGALAGITGLRRLVEPLRRGLARPVGGGEIGPAIERVVGRRLQPGLRAGSGGALVDRGIQKLGERRPDRRKLGPVGLGPGRARRVFLGMPGWVALGFSRRTRSIGRSRHRWNMAPGYDGKRASIGP